MSSSIKVLYLLIQFVLEVPELVYQVLINYIISSGRILCTKATFSIYVHVGHIEGNVFTTVYKA